MKRTARILSAILSVALTAAVFAGCGGKTAAKSGVEDGVLTIAMECAYAPYNWTQADDSNGAVPIKDSKDYANGYDIMMAKKILVVVSGEDKAETVKNAFFGPVTPQVPASILQMHPDVTIVADEAALSKCDL